MGGASSPSKRLRRSASRSRWYSRRASMQASTLSTKYWTKMRIANTPKRVVTQASGPRATRSFHTGDASRAFLLPSDDLQHLAGDVARVDVGVVRADDGERGLPALPGPAERVGGVPAHPPRQVAQARDQRRDRRRGGGAESGQR